MQDQCNEIRFLAGVYASLNPCILHIMKKTTEVLLEWDFSNRDILMARAGSKADHPKCTSRFFYD